jgi:methionyl-tRNA formyltransferase
MRFAFFGYDYSIDLAQTLVAQGHELLALFTFPCDQMFAYNLQTYALAEALQVPITDKKVNEEHIKALLAIGCETFLVAGYPRKIPPIDETKAYGINIHPALLPRARGITPAPHIIMSEPEAGGFTVHKLAPVYDAGDVLYQEAIAVDERTDVEVYSSRVALRSAAMITDIFANLPTYWKNAKPQDESRAGSYPGVSNEMRTLDWGSTAGHLNKMGRAFGRYGVLATVQNNAGEQQKLGVFQFSAWEEKHGHRAGTLMRSSPREIVIAIADGFVVLKDFQIIG